MAPSEYKLSFVCLLGSIFAMINVGLPTSKKNCVIYFIESPSYMMKNAFIVLKALFVLKIFKFLPRLFGNVEKTA